MVSGNRGPQLSALVASGLGRKMRLDSVSYLESACFLFMKNPHRVRMLCIAGPLACWALCLSPIHALAGRAVIALDGQWEIAEGHMESVPAQFEHRVPVPGLVDEAQPPFAEVGQKSPKREAFWYRRTFQVKGERARRRGAEAAQGGLWLARVPEWRSAGRAHAQLHARLFRCAARLARQRGRERTGRPRRGLARGAAAHRRVGLGLSRKSATSRDYSIRSS